MSVDNAQSVMSVSSSSVTLSGGYTSNGNSPYLFDSIVLVCRNVPLVGSSHPVRSEHIQSVSCILGAFFARAGADLWQNGHSVHIGGCVGSQLHSPNLQ